jgi:hypothetical protein
LLLKKERDNYIAWWNEIPVVGGLAGAIFGNPEEKAHEKALRDATQQMFAYRPELMDARMNVIGNMSHAFEPMNNIMGQAYGPQAQFNMQSMVKNPFTDDAQLRMRQMAHPTPKGPPGGGFWPQAIPAHYNINDKETGSGTEG